MIWSPLGAFDIIENIRNMAYDCSFWNNQIINCVNTEDKCTEHDDEYQWEYLKTNYPKEFESFIRIKHVIFLSDRDERQ